MAHRYRVTVQPIDRADVARNDNAIVFEVSNHDDLLEILARIENRRLLPEDEAAPFAIGLKLFTEVLIRHRREPLFAELGEAMARFMTRLKGQVRREQTNG